MKILGIDPGLNTFGCALLEIKEDLCKLKDWQSFNTKRLKTLTEKLLYIYNQLNIIIEKYEPNYIALEEVFVKAYPTSSAKLAQAQAVVLLVAGLKQIPVKLYHPSEVKKAFTRSGKAKKEEIARMFKLFFKNNLIESQTLEKEDDHKVDALALALLLALEIRG